MIVAANGISRKNDAFEAGKEAASRAISGLTEQPDILWVFGAGFYDQELLLRGITAISGEVPLIGCSTDGEISPDGLSSASVTVMALAADTVTFHTVLTQQLSHDSFQSGVAIGQAFSGLDCRYLQLFSDGLTGNAVKIIDGIKSVLGPEILIAGGAAGDDGKFIKTFQYYNGQVLTDSVVAVAFTGEFSLGTGAGCGWFPIGTAKKVTKAEGTILYELDGQPALPVYEKFLGKYAEQLPMVGVEYPLGIIDSPQNQEDVSFFICRATMGVDREHQSIRFAGEIPHGSMVKMTMGNDHDLLEAARNATNDALRQMREHNPLTNIKAVFLYSCMARKIVLGSKTAEEIDEIQKIVGKSTPIIGFYTYGEYAPTGKSNLSAFHNETVTISIIGE
jgi:hypothetical protein